MPARRIAIIGYQIAIALFGSLMFAAWAFSESLPMRITLTRVAMLSALALLAAYAACRARGVRRALTDTFRSPQHPLTLAVFRIVMFGVLFMFITPERIAWWAALPDALQAPPGTGIPVWPLVWRLSFWPDQPFSAGQLLALGMIVRIICVVGMLGLCSRTCALLAAAGAFVLVGAPQWYGKVDHHHHLVWFMLILACSRCSDALSIDAIIQSWRRADHGDTAPAQAHARYRLPLALVWVLMGVIYFFAGWWKLWTCGLDWAIGENFRWVLYNHWHGAGHFLPVVRIDRWPVVYQLGALGAVLFEMGFVFCVLFRRTRLPAAAVGFAFHLANTILLRITFWTLQWCYVVFVDWHRLLAALGRALYRKPMHVVYDGHCKLCRRTIATLRVFDLLGGITYVNALDDRAKRDLGLTADDDDALLRDMHALRGGRRAVGYDAYVAMAWRNVALMPALPLLYLPPVRALGTRIYRRIADSRTCSIVDVPKPAPTTAHASHTPMILLLIVGVALVAGNVLAGATKLGYAWPLACYPTFDSFYGPTSGKLRITVVSAAGIESPFRPADHPNHHTSRWRQLLKNILVNRDAVRLRALWSSYAQGDASLHDIKAVRFYEDVFAVDPARWADAPLETHLLLEWRIPADSITPTPHRPPD